MIQTTQLKLQAAQLDVSLVLDAESQHPVDYMLFSKQQQ
jgi:hypothetical protein